MFTTVFRCIRPCSVVALPQTARLHVDINLLQLHTELQKVREEALRLNSALGVKFRRINMMKAAEATAEAIESKATKVMAETDVLLQAFLDARSKILTTQATVVDFWYHKIQLLGVILNVECKYPVVSHLIGIPNALGLREFSLSARMVDDHQKSNLINSDSILKIFWNA
ncbi:hypothetical protein B7494_g4789 [Chlorociboria aeruginascens]|nr:hypothetical protein B7494_g4789 [Chlorociboria aeruginascens]